MACVYVCVQQFDAFIEEAFFQFFCHLCIVCVCGSVIANKTTNRHR